LSYVECNAKSKRTGEKCKARAVLGKTKCYHHGGATPRGRALPQTTSGKWSEDLPTRLAGRYKEARADTELLGLREEVSLIDSRLADLLKRVDTNEAGYWWKELQRVYKEYRAAERKAELPAMIASLREWGDIVQSGVNDYAAWNEIQNTLEQRRKLVESERKRLIEMQQVITSERAMLLISALVGIVQNHVTDDRTLKAISADVGKLITIGVSEQSD
jgi:hypothetical protein